MQPADGDPVLDRQPREDVGAETLARFRYQSEVAARAVFATLDGSVELVVCEWHEDHLILHRDGIWEFVSVKHRERDQGPWSLRLLISDGGLAHLLSRWRDVGRRCRCSVATNGGLKPDAQTLADALAARDQSVLDDLANERWRQLGAVDASEAREFFGSLSIEPLLPDRRDISASNLRSYVRPALRRAGLPESLDEKAYEGVVEMIDAASRDESASGQDLLGYISNPNRLRAEVLRQRTVESRTIGRQQVRDAVGRAQRQVAPLIAPVTVARTTNLVRKLQTGGFGPTHVDSAPLLRAAWTEFEAAYRDDLTDAGAQIDDIRARVRVEVAEAEDEAISDAGPGGEYGIRMFAGVKSRVRVDAIESARFFPLDDLLLLGLVYQLTDECPVWWSPRFELEQGA